MTASPAAPARHVEHCMGTVFSFDVRAPGVERAGIDAAVAWLHHVDAVFSPFRADSAVSRLRAGATTMPSEVRDVIARCAELSARTDGYFSAHFGGEFDPSGYVKGWAIEVASDILSSAGSRNHCVNGGGDVQCVGEAAPGREWRVGIADPRRPGQLLDVMAGRGRFAVATSGIAERGSHIVDPHTGHAPEALASVSVSARSLTAADALATAAFAMDAAAADWLARQPGVSALIAYTDGGRRYVRGSATPAAPESPTSVRMYDLSRRRRLARPALNPAARPRRES